jgi:hypothetical protein
VFVPFAILVYFWRADSGKNTVFEWFSKFKSVMISVDSACLACSLMSEREGNLYQAIELSCKTEESLIHEGDNILGIFLGFSTRHFERQSERVLDCHQFHAP